MNQINWKNCNTCNSEINGHDRIHGICIDCRMKKLEQKHFANIKQNQCVVCNQTTFQYVENLSQNGQNGKNLKQNGKYCNNCLFNEVIIKH